MKYIVNPYNAKLDAIGTEFDTYGSFYDTTIQQLFPNTIGYVKLNTTAFNKNVVIANDTFGNPTKIEFAKKGKYDIQFSAQVYKTSGGGSADANFWFSKGGVDIADSNTFVTMVSNSQYVVAAWNFFVDVNAGEYVQLNWYHTGNVELYYVANTLNYPATPSVILTINKVGS